MNRLPDRWAVADIARYLQLTPKHTRESIITRPGFPAPCINVSRRTRFWSAEAVRKWAAGR